MIAIFEMVEFLADLIVICVRRLRKKYKERKERNKVNDEEQSSSGVDLKMKPPPSRENSWMREGGKK